MPHEIGDLLNNRYRIEKVIAQGGMGAIYLAKDESLNVSVAVKENLYPSEESSRQFKREATILANLRHPNLPRVTDHFIFKDQGQYLIMDYIDGEDLHERLDRLGTIPEVEAITIGASVCDALTYLHGRQPAIIHRDIKPGNIKITPDGEIFLVDFGLAKQNQPGQATTTGAQALTPGYAPPEQYGQGTDARSDIYSLAATLYTAICKNIPEEGMARLMGNSTLTPVHIHNSAISEQTAYVIEKALSVRREERFESASEFKNYLIGSRPIEPINTVELPQKTRVSDNRMNQALPTSLNAETSRSAQFSKQRELNQKHNKPKSTSTKSPNIISLILLGGILFLFLIIMSIFLIWKKLNPAPVAIQSSINNQVTVTKLSTITATVFNTPTPEIQVEVNPVITVTPTLMQAIPSPMVTPLGGSMQIAYTASTEGIPQVWLMDNDGNNRKQLTSVQDGACQPDWSPDGTKLVIISPCKTRQDTYKGSSLFLINTDGRNMFPLASIPGGDFDPAWSPDGTRIIFTSLRDGNINLYLYLLSENKVRRLTNGIAIDRHASWAPDGKRITFERYQTDIPVIWTMEIGEKALSFSSDLFASIMPDWSPAGDVIMFSQGSTLPWLAARQVDSKGAPEARISDIRPAYNVDYSNDGFWIVFESQLNGIREIFRMMSNGSNLKQLTQDSVDAFQPRWRPMSNN